MNEFERVRAYLTGLGESGSLPGIKSEWVESLAAGRR